MAQSKFEEAPSAFEEAPPAFEEAPSADVGRSGIDIDRLLMGASGIKNLEDLSTAEKAVAAPARLFGVAGQNIMSAPAGILEFLTGQEVLPSKPSPDPIDAIRDIVPEPKAIDATTISAPYSGRVGKLQEEIKGIFSTALSTGKPLSKEDSERITMLEAQILAEEVSAKAGKIVESDRAKKREFVENVKRYGHRYFSADPVDIMFTRTPAKHIPEFFLPHLRSFEESPGLTTGIDVGADILSNIFLAKTAKGSKIKEGVPELKSRVVEIESRQKEVSSLMEKATEPFDIYKLSNEFDELSTEHSKLNKKLSDKIDVQVEELGIPIKTKAKPEAIADVQRKLTLQFGVPELEKARVLAKSEIDNIQRTIVEKTSEFNLSERGMDRLRLIDELDDLHRGLQEAVENADATYANNIREIAKRELETGNLSFKTPAIFKIRKSLQTSGEKIVELRKELEEIRESLKGGRGIIEGTGNMESMITVKARGIEAQLNQLVKTQQGLLDKLSREYQSEIARIRGVTDPKSEALANSMLNSDAAPSAADAAFDKSARVADKPMPVSQDGPAMTMDEFLLKDVQKIPEKGFNLARGLRRVRNLVKTIAGKSVLGMIDNTTAYEGRLRGTANEMLLDEGLHRGIYDEPPVARLDDAGGKILKDVMSGVTKTDDANIQRYSRGYRRVLDYLFNEAIQAGFKIPYVKDYIPRMLRSDILRSLYGESQMLWNNVEQLVREIDPGRKLTRDEAGRRAFIQIIDKHYRDFRFPDIVESYIKHRADNYSEGRSQSLWSLFRNVEQEYKSPFGSLDYHRGKQLFPEEFYEQDARILLDSYIRRATKRISEAKHLGLDGEKVTKQLLGMELAANPIEQKLLHRVLRRFMGLNFDERFALDNSLLAKAAEYNAGLQYLTKISLAYMPYMQQPVQPFISFINQVGYRRAFQGLLEYAFDPATRKFIRESGTTSFDPFEMMTALDETVHQKWFRRAGFAFGWENIWNKKFAAAAYNVWIRDLYNLSRNPKAVRSSWAKKWMDDLEIDTSKPLNTDDVIRAMYRMATDSQLQTNILNEPLVFSNPYIKPLLVLKRFTVKQFYWTKDLLTKEAKKGNVIPILRLGANSVATGELMTWIRNTLREAISGDVRFREEDSMWQRLINDVAEASTFGWVGDFLLRPLAELRSGGEPWRQLRTRSEFLLTPSVFAFTPDEFVTNALDKGDTDTALRRTIAGIGPLFRDLSQMWLTDNHTKFNQLMRKRADYIKRVSQSSDPIKLVEIWNSNHPFQDRIRYPGTTGWIPSDGDDVERQIKRSEAGKQADETRYQRHEGIIQ